MSAAWHRIDRHVVVTDGFYLLVDDQDSLGLLVAGEYEPYEMSLLKSIVTPGSAVVDIGANIGYHTVHFARAAGPSGHVFAFEPEPDNLRLLAHNLRTNGFDNVTIIPKAASDTPGPCQLFLSRDNHGDHRVYDSGDRRHAIGIESVTVDDALAGVHGPVSLIKLDIQGAEPMAMRGMQRFIARHPEAWIATELWPIGLQRSGSSLAAYLDQLRRVCMTLLRIDERRRRITPLDLEWLADTVTVERGNHTNLLLPRRDWVQDSAVCLPGAPRPESRSCA